VRGPIRGKNMIAIDERLWGLSSIPEFLGPAILTYENSVSHSAPTPTAPFSAVYAFGDSLSDAGNDYIATGGGTPVSPPYSDGRFTNGPVWVQDLSSFLGLGPLAPSLAQPNVPNRTDFAFGGAETGTTPLHTADATDLPSQLAQFHAAVPNPQPDALYTVSIGSNDLFGALEALPSNPAAAIATVQSAVVNVDNFVSDLAAGGAKNLLILDVPDLGKIPDVTSQGPLASLAASALSGLFDVELAASLQTLAGADQLKLDLLSAYSLADQEIAHPSWFGLTNVTDPVWTGNYTDASSGTLRATTPAAQNQYLFWDSVHPTAQGHAVAAALAYDSLVQQA
jgi:phospholipase/lecithinase/hemolysin